VEIVILKNIGAECTNVLQFFSLAFSVVAFLTVLNFLFLCIYVVGLLHGDMSQFERNDVITAFKQKSTPILAATDVAGMTQNQPVYISK